VVDVDELAEKIAAKIGRPQPLYSPRTLAERLEISERTVREMLERGDIASFKVGGARRIDPEEVERYLRERRADA
jgi:excisionase family DNA binding protein